MSTFGDLYGTELDTLLGTEDRSVRFTLARRKAAVNDAIRWFSEQTGCFVRRASIALVDGTAEYDLEGSAGAITNGDYLRPSKTSASLRRYDGSGSDVTDYSYVEGPDLPFKSEEQLNQERRNWRAESATVPDCWTLRADGGAQYLVLVPAPDIPSGETWVLFWPYVARPADLTADSDEPYQVSTAIRTSLRAYHKGIAYYAASVLEELRKNYDMVDRRLKMAAAYVTKYYGDTARPTGASMRLKTDFRARLRNRRPMDPTRFP